MLGIWDFKSREQHVNTMITESSFKALRYALYHRAAKNETYQDKAKKATSGWKLVCYFEPELFEGIHQQAAALR